MWVPDQSSFQLITNMSAHLAFMCQSALVCMVFAYILQIRTAGPLKAIGLSVTEILLGEALGLLFAKGVYFLIRMEYLTKLGGAWQFFTSLDMKELCFFGGVGGVVLAVVFSARIFGLPVRKVMNHFAPAGALLIALARFAEYYLQNEMLGLGGLTRIGLAEDTVLKFPWGIAIDWFGDGSYMEYYLAVFMYEGFVAAAAAVISLICVWDRDCFIRTLFYICLAQVLLESIRSTAVAWLFVRAEQLMCFLYVEGVLVLYAIRRIRQGKRYGIISPILGLLVAGVVVLVEFGLENKIDFMKELGAMKMYIIMASALATLGIADIVHHIVGYRMKKRPALQ